MNTKAAVSLVILCFLAVNQASPALACGPNYQHALFSYTRHAGYPLKNYTAGKIGVVPETYGRMSLFVFYRELMGRPLSPFERSEVEAALQTRIRGMSREALAIEAEEKAAKTKGAPKSDKDEYYNPHHRWMEVREKIIAGAQPPTLVEKEKYNPNTYSSHQSCLDDAFRTALKTLESRRGQYGVSTDLQNWVSGQDKVFSNCGGKGLMPEPLAENAPDWLRKDRAYQLAAAYFYRDEFTEARTMFEQISRDKDSPWSQTARFLLARIITREADAIDIGEDYNPKRTAANAVNWDSRVALYGQAAEQLRAIMADPSMEYFHASARRLLARAAYRTNPEARRNELAAILSNPNENRFIFHDLKDYISLLDDAEDVAEDIGADKENARREAAGEKETISRYEYKTQVADYADDVMSVDLTNWLITYQIEGKAAFEHAHKKWKETGSRAWLLSAVAKARINNGSGYAGTTEVSNAADAIPPGSAGFTGARFHVTRLLAENNERAEARQKLAEVKIGELPLSSRNDYLGLKTALAANLTEYLQSAQRKPVGVLWDYDSTESGFSYMDEEDPADIAMAKKAWFDQDAVAFFSERAPLSTVVDAANSRETSPNLKKFLYSMAWARALVLKRGELAQSMARQLKQYAPEYAPALSKYAAAVNANDRDAAGLIAILRYPKVDANLPVGIGREHDSAVTMDSNRGNWWCFQEEGKRHSSNYGAGYWTGRAYDGYEFEYPRLYPDFLSAQQVRENERERKTLLESGQSATFLNKAAVEFAKANPNHRDTPELLHLAVRASRFGCKDDQTEEFAKQAFQFLHRRFPGNYWTKKTPYYYG